MVERLKLLGLFFLCVFASVYAAIRLLYLIAKNPTKAWRLALSHDQLGNTAMNGHEDESISSRAGRKAREGNVWACRLCKFLDKFDKNHCEKSIERQFIKEQVRRIMDHISTT
jgi:hypothetical protein